MGTSINLTIADLSIDYAKNEMGSDHGPLFQEEDRQRRRSDQINYDYYKQNSEEDLPSHEASFARPLSRILPRLTLLGFTINSARFEYEELVRKELELNAYVAPNETPVDFMSFDEYCSFVCVHPLSELDDTYIECNETSKGRFRSMDAEISRIPNVESWDLFWSERSYFGSVVCVLSPYSMLQVFGQSKLNANAEVVWQYGPIVNSGWVALQEFKPLARRSQKILVVTEGSSDARVIKHALDLLSPDIQDFFCFVDLEGSHPFWGTGNLVKFAEGLLRIDVQNQIIFILDNDAEGLDAHKRLTQLNLPTNMRVTALPELDEFSKFPTRGPEGIIFCDINKRAAAIECYLDLNLPNCENAHIQWSNYKKESATWQGALENKDSYMRYFLKQTAKSLQKKNYDTSKLDKVLCLLLSEAAILISKKAE